MPQEPLQLDTVGWNRKLKLWQRKLPTRQVTKLRQGVGRAGAILVKVSQEKNMEKNWKAVKPTLAI